MKKTLFFVLNTFAFLVLYSCNGVKKYKTAYISKSANGYEITLRGRGTGHPAGPSDVFFPRTFSDSFILDIPSYQAVINCTDVKAPNTNFKFTKGNIIIDNKSLRVELFSTDTDYPPNDPLYWNGSYDLEWRK
jgi:hypothetical protein